MNAKDSIFLGTRGSALVVALLADKWTIPVIHALGHGTRRTGELRKQLDGISQKMLTQTLRILEEHAILDRKVFAVVPPRVEYTLTELGRSLNEPLKVLCKWTERNGASLERAHARRGQRAP